MHWASLQWSVKPSALTGQRSWTSADKWIAAAAAICGEVKAFHHFLHRSHDRQVRSLMVKFSV